MRFEARLESDEGRRTMLFDFGYDATALVTAEAERLAEPGERVLRVTRVPADALPGDLSADEQSLVAEEEAWLLDRAGLPRRDAK